MRESLVRHEIVKYQRNEPFHTSNATESAANDVYVKNSHWHEELEIDYVVRGDYYHYIDGEPIHAVPGRLIVTNCESVHHILVPQDRNIIPGETHTIVLLIHNRFIEENFPEYRDFWFTNDKPQARPEIRDIMLRFSDYGRKTEHAPYEHLYMRGLLLQLLYYLFQEGTVSRTNITSIRQHEQVQTLKEILQYVEEHFREPLTQADIARKFYFTPQYFSRYFKQCTGITFIEHLTAYRTYQAKQELLHTDRRISDIALDCGFHDDRSLINAFRKRYQVTPLQYRKNHLYGGSPESGSPLS